MRFVLDRAVVPPADAADHAPVEAEGYEADGMMYEVILHILEGYIDRMQIHRMDGRPLSQYPDPDKLHIEEPIDSVEPMTEGQNE